MSSPLHNPFFPRDSCIDCPKPETLCNCKANESCVLTTRDCVVCETVTCVPQKGSSGGGVSGGAVAGAVVGCLLAAVFLAGGLWYLRRRRAQRKAQVMAGKRRSPYTMEHGPATPGSEKPPATPGSMPGTPGLGPASPRSPNAPAGTNHTLHYTESDINLDPFSDAQSVRSGTSSHVIPIAYVPPTSASMSLADGHRQSSVPSLSPGSPFPPSRPFRSPELNLRLEPPKSAASRLSVGQDLRPPRFSNPYAASQRSGMSRASTVSSVGSFIYGDTPVVVSQAQGGVRQVLGVARPEVVQVHAGGLTTPTTPGSGTGAQLVRSWSQRKSNAPPLPPLPSPSVPERSPFSPESETGHDPFADRDDDHEHTTHSVRSANTFGQPNIPGASLGWNKSPNHPQSATFLAEPVGYDSRPSSIGTVVESAQRVMLGGTASASTEDLNMRMPPPLGRRISGASVADSILSGFPFVPPSPIAQGESAHRPGSLAMSISESVVDHPQSNSNSGQGAMPTLSELARQEEEALGHGQVARLPSRHTLGMSTFSSTSGVSSSGLEAFPFHFGAGGAARDSIDTHVDVDLGASKPPAPARASLDTLALSRDVEAFPLQR